MGDRPLAWAGVGMAALEGVLAELAAADELITELVTENEELRARIAQRTSVATDAGRAARPWPGGDR